jgi:hypothetical protein
MTQVVAGGSEENNKDASLSMGVMHLKMQAEEQLKELEPLFQNNLESYLVVINRLRKHEASL